MSGMVAALFVETGGVYFGLPDVDPWDEARDARKYAGPWPVVAHPPCERWGRFAGDRRGDDGGCFAAALRLVRTYDGVLEHPAGSYGWEDFNIRAPRAGRGWESASDGGYVCSVEQGHFGHRARKATWLYAFGVELPELPWGPSTVPPTRKGAEARTEEERRRAIKTGIVQNLSRKQRRATPPAFRDLLLSIARSAVRP